MSRWPPSFGVATGRAREAARSGRRSQDTRRPRILRPGCGRGSVSAEHGRRRRGRVEPILADGFRLTTRPAASRPAYYWIGSRRPVQGLKTWRRRLERGHDPVTGAGFAPSRSDSSSRPCCCGRGFASRHGNLSLSMGASDGTTQAAIRSRTRTRSHQRHLDGARLRQGLHQRGHRRDAGGRRAGGEDHVRR